jgi:DtxR family transcriptional regulator, Mn-dependent transcriptional regulator
VLTLQSVMDERRFSDTVQDYAKAIYSLESRDGGPVSTTAVAERMSVSAASASGMVKRLAELGLATHVRYGGIALTDDGRRLALEVLRHHRLVELFLAEALGMSWERVHDEAEVLEHVLSEEVEELIAAKLGDPVRDPHGDPIPSRELTVDERQTAALDSLSVGDAGVFARISDSDPEMLRYLAALGVRPGDALEVVEKQPFGGPLSVRFGDAVHILGGGLAQAMRVEVTP